MATQRKNEPLAFLAERAGARITNLLAGSLGELTFARFRVLYALVETGGREFQRSLVDASEIDRSTLSELLRRMEGMRLVTILTPKEDARTRIVRITPKGRRLEAQARERLLAMERGLEKSAPRARRALEEIASIGDVV